MVTRPLLEAILFGSAMLLGALLREGDTPAVTQAIFWLPTGVAIACVWRLGKRGLLVVALAVLLQRLWSGYSAGIALSAVIGSTAEAALGAFLLRRLGLRGDFRRLRDALALFAAAALAPLASILGSLGGRSLLQDWGNLPVYSGWDGWWRMNALGTLCVVPALLGWLHRPKHTVRGEPWLLLASCSASMAFLWFGMTQLPATPTSLLLLHLALPMLVVAALRCGPAGAATASAASAILVAFLAARGIGPFECVDYGERHTALQLFLGTLLGVPLLLASLIAERETGLCDLARSEGLQHALLRVLPDTAIRCDAAGRVLDLHSGANEPDRSEPPWQLGQLLVEALPEQARGSLRLAIQTAAAGEYPAPVECRVADQVLEFRCTRLLAEEVLCLVRDVSAARRAEQLLAFEARILQQIASGRPDTEVFAAVVAGIEEFLRGGRASLLRLAADQLQVACAPNLPAEYNAATEGMQIGPDRGACGTAAYWNRIVVCADLATDPRWAGARELTLRHGLRACWSVPVRSAAGAVLGTFAIYHDHPREPTEAELAVVQRAATLTGIAIEREQRESLLAAIQHNVGEGIYRSLPRQGLVYANTALARLFGYQAPAELLEVAAAVAQGRQPADIQPEHAADLRRFATAMPLASPTEVLLHRRDGSSFYGLFSCTAVHGPDGNKVACDGAVADVTARRELETRLRQAQKMDAVGKLAGGIAHDFNNLLTAIGGYAEAARAAVPANDSASADLAEIRRAVQRASGLTRQLLLFSRQQVLTPQVLDLTEVVDELTSMLRRLIGAEIELVVTHEARPCTVRIDASQLEQVLLNLALNARDAMPTGGCLRINTSIVERSITERSTTERSEVASDSRQPLAAQQLACLTVSDDGIGMSEEVRSRACEPFFTTKEVGKGTGLGLATVYGIVQQSGGHLQIDSRSGQGTTVRIQLPLVDTAVAAAAPTARLLPPEPPTARILVAEDEDVVRELLLRILRRAGHTAIGAADAAAAIATAANQPAFDLLITDLVMPGKNGGELALELRALQPGLRVLFISGYANQPNELLDKARADVDFLQKPFDADSLLQRCNQLLAVAPTASNDG